MGKLILILAIALVIESTGVVILSAGLKQVGEPARISVGEIALLLKRGATNRNVLLGIFLEAIFFGMLLYMLSQRDVSMIWPLTAVGFLFTALIAKLYLHEEVSPVRWAGIGLIAIGASLVSYSEKLKEKKPGPPPVASERVVVSGE
jgi:drug/metabolite transporter (DMT)-like permease